jgi:putative DNA topoisomerase
MVLRQGRFGMFIGCSRYPECEHTEQIDKPDETAIACPQCQRSSGPAPFPFGKTFHSCDRYPDCQFVINFKPVAGMPSMPLSATYREENRARHQTLLCQ